MKTSAPHKISLVVLGLVVVALLAPYAGCNGLTTTPSTSSNDEDESASTPASPARNPKPYVDEPLDQIDGLLSN